MNWETVNTVVLALTLIVVGIYTRFTYLILKENEKIRLSQSDPFLHFSLCKREIKKDAVYFKCCLKNLGKGHAIKLHPVLHCPKSAYTCGNQAATPSVIESAECNRKSYEVIFKTPNKLKINTDKALVMIECHDTLGHKHIFKYDFDNAQKLVEWKRSGKIVV